MYSIAIHLNTPTCNVVTCVRVHCVCICWHFCLVVSPVPAHCGCQLLCLFVFLPHRELVSIESIPCIEHQHSVSFHVPSLCRSTSPACVVPRHQPVSFHVTSLCRSTSPVCVVPRHHSVSFHVTILYRSTSPVCVVQRHFYFDNVAVCTYCMTMCPSNTCIFVQIV